MDIEQRRSLIDSRINTGIHYRQCCPQNYLNATVDDREAFNSEVLYTSVGSREILAIFKAGENNTPQDRAFDLYLPKHIKSGIYQLNMPNQLIQIAFTENFPAHTTFWATGGTIDLAVDADAQGYRGRFEIKFRDRQNVEFSSDGLFEFSLKNT
ncbi:hypothetical protein [Pseudomonas violetae]|jgi:hypothetical protein|uniref:Uncharacterized protein n=1 Tax=Pseudomonas violetae TaxID=2915813 RepID=A0ABT0F0C2_9PSED|nr:hypothetical protein [Pseudomonas violetae]MCK1791450.1 hypothetical protein [Pseudomonas violetae]